MTTPMRPRVAPKVRKSWRWLRAAATRPPVSPPRVVATSRAIPRRMFTSPRSRLIVEEAEAVAITEMRLAAMAARIGTPRESVSRGTRKTPPPRPSSAPTRPVAAPVNTRTKGEIALTL